jgi:hypothetical protein
MGQSQNKPSAFSMGLSQNRTAVFSISRVRTVLVHSVCSVRTLLRQYPSISDSLYVNSRTLDIGKAGCPILRQPHWKSLLPYFATAPFFEGE